MQFCFSGFFKRIVADRYLLDIQMVATGITTPRMVEEVCLAVGVLCLVR